MNETLDRYYRLNDDVTSLGLKLRAAMNLTDDPGQWKSFIRTHGHQIASIRNWWWWL